MVRNKILSADLQKRLDDREDRGLRSFKTHHALLTWKENLNLWSEIMKQIREIIE